MKKSIILLVLTLSFGQLLNAQNSEKSNCNYLIAGGAYNFQFQGDASNEMVNTLFANFSGTKRKGHIWKFKKVEIPGLDMPVTFQVHSGISGSNHDGSGYFHTFRNEADKELKLAQLSNAEDQAIIIYVRKGNHNVLQSKEDAELVKQYLLSLEFH